MKRDPDILKRTSVVPFLCAILLGGCASAPDRPPAVAGQVVPNQSVLLDFTKLYNVTFRDGQGSRTFLSCRIVGYTGAQARNADGSVSDQRSGGFNRWLALELPGGRRVFIPAGSVSILEESFK